MPSRVGSEMCLRDWQMVELFQNMNPDMDFGAMADSMSSGGVGMNGMDISEIMDFMKMFGGNDNGNKQ